MRRSPRQGHQADDNARNNSPFVVEEYELCNPCDKGCLRAHRLVFEPDGIAYLVKPFLRMVFYDGHLTRQNPTITDCRRWGSSCAEGRCISERYLGARITSAPRLFPRSFRLNA